VTPLGAGTDDPESDGGQAVGAEGADGMSAFAAGVEDGGAEGVSPLGAGIEDPEPDGELTGVEGGVPGGRPALATLAAGVANAESDGVSPLGAGTGDTESAGVLAAGGDGAMSGGALALAAGVVQTWGQMICLH
jgi:hypothetical protein